MAELGGHALYLNRRNSSGSCAKTIGRYRTNVIIPHKWMLSWRAHETRDHAGAGKRMQPACESNGLTELQPTLRRWFAMC
jgi:hypothetical protein